MGTYTVSRKDGRKLTGEFGDGQRLLWAFLNFYIIPNGDAPGSKQMSENEFLR